MFAIRNRSILATIGAATLSSVAVLFALNVTGKAFGQTAVVSKTLGSTAALSWNAPTQYTDGSTIATGAVVTFNVYDNANASCSANYATSSASLIASALASPAYTTPPFTTAGAHCYEVTAIVGGVESGPSNVAAVVVVNPIPKAPASLTVK